MGDPKAKTAETVAVIGAVMLLGVTVVFVGTLLGVRIVVDMLGK